MKTDDLFDFIDSVKFKRCIYFVLIFACLYFAPVIWEIMK